MPEYLYACTSGVVGLLERLIEDGCTEAITSGTECLTEPLLDSLPITFTPTAGRDAGAGGIPIVPSRPRRRRNGAFDDRGHTPATACVPHRLAASPRCRVSCCPATSCAWLTGSPSHLWTLAACAAWSPAPISPPALWSASTKTGPGISPTSAPYPAEVHGLTLAGQAPGYTPLHIDYLGRHQSAVTTANDGWVLTAFSRYCPDCLRDSADVPGGPVWDGAWRLTHTFLCERHYRILDWQCRVCHASAFSNGYRGDGRWRPTHSTAHIRLRHHAQHCSPAMTAVIRRSVRFPRKAAGPPALFPQPATHRGRLDPDAILAPLPEHWTAPLDELDAPKRQLCRDAAIRLVQMSTGCSRRSAAFHIQIPLGALHSATSSVQAWQKEPGNAASCQKALHRVAEIAIAEGHTDQGDATGG